MEHEAKSLEAADPKPVALAVAGRWTPNAASADADAAATPDAAEHVTIIAPNVTIDALVESIKPVQLS